MMYRAWVSDGRSTCDADRCVFIKPRNNEASAFGTILDVTPRQVLPGIWHWALPVRPGLFLRLRGRDAHDAAELRAALAAQPELVIRYTYETPHTTTPTARGVS